MKNTVVGRISRLVSSVASFGGNPITGGRSDKQARQQRQPLRDFPAARCHPDPHLKPQLPFCFENSLLIAKVRLPRERNSHSNWIGILFPWQSEKGIRMTISRSIIVILIPFSNLNRTFAMGILFRSIIGLLVTTSMGIPTLSLQVAVK